MGPEPFLEHMPLLSLPGLVLWGLSLFTPAGRRWAAATMLVIIALAGYAAYSSERWPGDSVAFHFGVLFTYALYPVLLLSWLVRIVVFLVCSVIDEKNGKRQLRS